jgi:hypothetical protein
MERFRIYTLENGILDIQMVQMDVAGVAETMAETAMALMLLGTETIAFSQLYWMKWTKLNEP